MKLNGGNMGTWEVHYMILLSYIFKLLTKKWFCNDDIRINMKSFNPSFLPPSLLPSSFPSFLSSSPFLPLPSPSFLFFLPVGCLEVVPLGVIPHFGDLCSCPLCSITSQPGAQGGLTMRSVSSIQEPRSALHLQACREMMCDSPP